MDHVTHLPRGHRGAMQRCHVVLALYLHSTSSRSWGLSLRPGETTITCSWTLAPLPCGQPAGVLELGLGTGSERDRVLGQGAFMRDALALRALQVAGMTSSWAAGCGRPLGWHPACGNTVNSSRGESQRQVQGNGSGCSRSAAACAPPDPQAHQPSLEPAGSQPHPDPDRWAPWAQHCGRKHPTCPCVHTCHL